MPGQLKDDHVIPSVTELPSILNSLRHPRKNRSVSIGPQSAADAHETIANRDRRRRASKSEKVEGRPDYFGLAMSNGVPKDGLNKLSKTLSRTSNPDDYLLKSEKVLYTPPDSQERTPVFSPSRQPSQERRTDEKEEREMFSKLEKPRVRYDVEVISKLIVYAGKVQGKKHDSKIMINTRSRYRVDCC